MVMLRERMQERYANWQADLSEEQMGADGQVMPGWRTFFAECPAPNWAAIPEALVIEDDAQAWPGRRNERLPQAPATATKCGPTSMSSAPALVSPA
ncbi:hypothetical protein SAMN05444413_11248 [Roseivivax marinus]|nr:hypothetical protein SAMN05444413_11248 [Roseivivax marinus]